MTRNVRPAKKKQAEGAKGLTTLKPCRKQGGYKLMRPVSNGFVTRAIIQKGVFFPSDISPHESRPGGTKYQM